jgi:hypothetical protein
MSKGKDLLLAFAVAFAPEIGLGFSPDNYGPIKIGL